MQTPTFLFVRSNAPACQSHETVRTRILVKNGEWLVPPAERPAGWEKFGLMEPLTVEEKLAAIAKLNSMNMRELEQWFGLWNPIRTNAKDYERK